MLITMSTSLLITGVLTSNLMAVLWTGVFMLLVALWAWRYPDSEEEYQRRVDAGKPVAWLR
jgi:hypothetical protein